MNLLDHGHDKGISPHLQWMNQPDSWGFDPTGKLTILAPPLADFFRDPAGEIVQSSAPFLYTKLQGDFTVSARVEVDMIAEFDSACIMIMIDDKNWAKVCFEFSNLAPTMVSVVTRGTSDDCNSQKVDEQKPCLRATRSGQCFAFHYSLDGRHWSMVRYFHMEAPVEVKVGLVAQSPAGNGCEVSFDYFEYSPEPIKNVRSGE